MAEYIDRKRLEEWLLNESASLDTADKECVAERIRHDIPSADVVERKRGMWVLYNKGFGFTHYCSNCNFEVKEQWIDFYNFCPNCGADMRESEGEDG